MINMEIQLAVLNGSSLSSHRHCVQMCFGCVVLGFAARKSTEQEMQRDLPVVGNISYQKTMAPRDVARQHCA